MNLRVQLTTGFLCVQAKFFRNEGCRQQSGICLVFIQLWSLFKSGEAINEAIGKHLKNTHNAAAVAVGRNHNQPAGFGLLHTGTSIVHT
jgi:hypothetical protein